MVWSKVGKDKKLTVKNSSKILLIAILIIASFLRIWKISEVPVSLFGDELDIGYHAFSILETGKDYSGNIWPLHFQSLAEWRTPLYLYAAVPTVALFGISPLGVRLPAVIFGVLGVWGIYLLSNKLVKKKFRIWNARFPRSIKFGILPALVLALSPWHLQYSRGAFEVTMLLAFLIFGLYFFFKSLKDGKWLWLSASLLVVTPLIYSTAKLFAPFLLVFLLLVWKKEIFKITKINLIRAIIALVLLGGLTSYATLFSGGGQRFNYISVFSDPTAVHEIDTARLQDARLRGETGTSISPVSNDRFYHNKLSYWTENVVKNYLKAFSTDFLFINGDPNLRHSIKGAAQLYWIEVLTLLTGIVLFFTRYKDKKVKMLITFWLLFGVFPSAITRDGGNHATRLIIILPPLIFLISYGLFEGIQLLRLRWIKFAVFIYFAIWLLGFIFYQHKYWVHNPWDSERWWHAGFNEAIHYVKENSVDYNKIFLSMTGEPMWIFFAGWYQYPVDKWQMEFPIGNDIFIEGFGRISHTDKFYFGSPQAEEGGVYSLNRFLEKGDLYLANASEVGENLIIDPGKVPSGLVLLKAIPYPSGEPAFYLFTR